MKILYIGWVGYKNIGDELMLENFKKLAKEKLGSDCIIKATMCSENFDNFNGYDVVCLGGGSILSEGFINVIYRALEQDKKIIIWGSGYDDIFEEEFCQMISKSEFAYIYSDLIEEKLDEIAKKANFFGVRGPITHRILKKSNLDISNIILSGDPGLLLEEEKFNNPYTFKKEDKYVGINVGTMFNKVYGGNEERVFEALLRVANDLISSGYKIYLYSMWPNDLDRILYFYNSIEETKNVILDMENRKGHELLTIIKNCVFTINFKLHANVISAAASVPFVCLGYRLKCYDFVKSLNQERLLVSTGSENIYEDVSRKIKYLKSNGEKVEKELENKVNIYKEKLRKSLDNLI